MDHIERYLSRVGFWLPRHVRAEITGSVREALEEQIESRQAEQPQPLSDAEVLEVIRRFGHPAVTASRYRNLPPLIEGDWMTVFWRVLLVGIPAIVIVQMWLVVLTLQDGSPFGSALMGGLARVATGSCIGFTVTTLAFAALSRYATVNKDQR